MNCKEKGCREPAYRAALCPVHFYDWVKAKGLEAGLTDRDLKMIRAGLEKLEDTIIARQTDVDCAYCREISNAKFKPGRPQGCDFSPNGEHQTYENIVGRTVVYTRPAQGKTLVGRLTRRG